MKQIEKYVQQFARMDAQTLTLASNAPVVVRTAAGPEKISNQVIEHAVVVATVQEVAPPQGLIDIRASRPTRFGYPEDDPAVTIEVVPTPGLWRVTLSRYEPPRAGARNRVSSPATARVVTPVPIAPAEPPPAAPPLAARLAPRVNAPPEPPAARQSALPPEAPSGPPTVALAEAPQTTGALDRLLRVMAAKGASDLHVSTGRPPMMRLHGEIKALEPSAVVLTAEALRALILPTMPEHVQKVYGAHHDADYAYERLAGVARFRANAFLDRHGPGAVFRRIPFEIVPAEELGLSRQVLELCNLTKGLVLVTGPTGSGKSTTLAALIDRVNATRKDHIITIEDPIEFVHRNRKCLVNQREVRVHTGSFKDALRAALREDPDIVLVGEMRDLETVAIAIETAETGHLVFGTLHTRTATSTVDRIIDQFPADRQAQIRTMLSESLKGVIAQTLCKRLGGGRVAAYEVLIGTLAVSNLIREGKTHQLPGMLQMGRNVGMITLNDSLCELVRAGRIDVREAWFRAVNKAEMRNVMTQQGMVVPDRLVG